MYNHKNGLVLAKIEREDLPQLKSLKDESWFGTHNVAVVNMADQNRWFDGTKSLVFKAMAINPTAVANLEQITSSAISLVPIGIFKVDNVNAINRTADVGWDVFSEWRGLGFGRKVVEAGVDLCFEILNTNRLDAEILRNNVASQKCAEKIGFVQEGTRRQAVYKCNEWLDSHVYGLVREDWVRTVNTRYGTGHQVCNESYQPKNSKSKDQSA